MIFIVNSTIVEKRGWNYDEYWLGPNKSAYVCIVPAVSKDDIWIYKEGKILVERIRIKNINPAQMTSVPSNLTSYGDIKSYLLEKYPHNVEIYWAEVTSWIKLLIDENGVVYWAGSNLKL